MKSYLVLIFAFICLKSDVNDSTKNVKLIETVFTKWNNATIASISVQSKKSKYPEWKLAFKKRLKVLTDILYSRTADESGEVDKGQPNRYKFLTEIHIDSLLKKHFFILETTLSGEVVQYRNYLIADSANKSHVFVYVYFRNKWKLTRDTIISKVKLYSKMNYYNRNVSLEGTNDTDMILTEFNSLKVFSRYYLAGSIIKVDDVLKISKF